MKKVIIALSLGGLTACGGGETSTTPFSSFSTLPQNGQTPIQGEAMTASYSADFQTGAVDTSTPSGPNGATAVVTSENGETTGLSISAPGSSVNFNENNAEATDLGDFIAAVTTDGEDFIFYADNETLGYEYQTYGVWLTGYNTGSGTVGVGTFGASTDSAVVAGRQNENASYSGFSTGLLEDVDGQPYLTASEISIVTDFNTATIISSGTEGVNFNDESILPVPSDFDFSGSGTVSGDGFTATISGDVVSGTTDGVFYGPNAEEVGGTFSSSAGGTTYVGSYGAN